MGELSEFSLPVRAFLRAYRWRRIHPVHLDAAAAPVVGVPPGAHAGATASPSLPLLDSARGLAYTRGTMTGRILALDLALGLLLSRAGEV